MDLLRQSILSTNIISAHHGDRRPVHTDPADPESNPIREITVYPALQPSGSEIK
jgi:hypothetical protein